MNTNLSPEISLNQDGASHGQTFQESSGEHEPVPAARRWELCPEIFQGQTLGWKVVRLI